MAHRQNGPILMAALSAADHKITVAAVHKMFGFGDTSPDQGSHRGAVIPFGLDLFRAEEVDCYLAMAFAREETVKDEKQFFIVCLI
jgi:hypothetical protein